MTPVTPAHAGWYLFLDASPVDTGFEKARHLLIEFGGRYRLEAT